MSLILGPAQVRSRTPARQHAGRGDGTAACPDPADTGDPAGLLPGPSRSPRSPCSPDGGGRSAPQRVRTTRGLSPRRRLRNHGSKRPAAGVVARYNCRRSRRQRPQRPASGSAAGSPRRQRRRCDRCRHLRPRPRGSSGPDVADIDSTAMPPVKLSTHMPDARAGKRFVIPQRPAHGEGDRNGEVTVGRDRTRQRE